MATTKMKDADALLSQLADELGISEDQLASMNIEEIRELIDSGDLDPSQKARLVRARLVKLRDEMDLAGEVLDGIAEGSAGSKDARQTEDVE